MMNIVMHGADWCPDCRRAKAFLKEHQIEFEYVDVDLDEEATKKVERINKGKRIIPTFEINGAYYTNPDNAALSRILGVNPEGRVALFGADWCPDCRRAKSYLQDNEINFQFIDIDQHEWAGQQVEKINKGKRIIPTILIDGTPHTNPDNARLKELLKIDSVAEEKLYDVVIIGAGAAGLTASIYCQRDKLDTLVLEKKNIGGNAFLTEKIENYPGFQSISGPELMDRMAQQTQTYGAEIKQGVEVLGFERKGSDFEINTNMGSFKGKSIVIATGSTYRRLEIPGEEELIGGGVHFCATCDGAFYRNKEVIVIGGGNSALEEGMFLARFCSKVKIISRKPEFTASKTYQDKLPEMENIETYMNKSCLEFLSNDQGLFSSLKIKDYETGVEEQITADGVFIFVGLVPNTSFLEGSVDLDDKKFIVTECATPLTSAPGVFAAGDCRQGAVAQVAAATGEGVLASYGVRRYLSEK